MKDRLFLAMVLSLVFFKVVSQDVPSRPVEKVISEYLNIQNFLFKGDGDSVRLYAKNLNNSIEGLQSEGMSVKEKKAFTQFRQKISYAAEYIKETNNVNLQREHFLSLSENMYKMLKSFTIATTLYYEFCPMANDNKGAYWLNSTPEIRNPYYGAKMPSCGSVKDSLISQQKSK